MADWITIDPAELHDASYDIPMQSKLFVPYTGRESFARYVIQTDSANISIRALQDLFQFPGGYNSAGVVVNDVPQGNGLQLGGVTQGGIGEATFAIGAGVKTVELIDGPCGEDLALVPPIRFTPVRQFKLDPGSTYSVIPKTAPAKLIIPVGDSISEGAFTDAGPNQASVYQSWQMLMRKNAKASGAGPFAGAQLLSASSGGNGYFEIASTSQKIADFVERLGPRLQGTVDNIVLWALGTNDWAGPGGGPAGFSAASIGAWAGALWDAIHTVYPSLTMWCFTPPHALNEGVPNAGGSTLAQVSAALAAEVALRAAYMQVADGFTFVTYPAGFAPDGVHLNTSGMAQYEASARAATGLY